MPAVNRPGERLLADVYQFHKRVSRNNLMFLVWSVRAGVPLRVERAPRASSAFQKRSRPHPLFRPRSTPSFLSRGVCVVTLCGQCLCHLWTRLLHVQMAPGQLGPMQQNEAFHCHLVRLSHLSIDACHWCFSSAGSTPRFAGVVVPARRLYELPTETLQTVPQTVRFAHKDTADCTICPQRHCRLYDLPTKTL